jgi:hypothetical protein
MKHLVIAASVVVALAGAGTALARITPGVHHHAAAKPRPTLVPTPSPTPSERPEIRATTAPSNGHHMVTGPNAATERHVIHTTGSVGVVSGNVSFGTSEHGAVGTPTPKP